MSIGEQCKIYKNLGLGFNSSSLVEYHAHGVYMGEKWLECSEFKSIMQY